MRSNCVISRRGILNAKGSKTDNQCAKRGHETYQYEIRVLFDPATKLDKSGWIIDHQLLDDAIQKAQIDSCEIMSKQILDAVEALLRKKKLRCIAIKLRIRPSFVAEENSAYFEEFRCARNKDLVLALCL